jgi:hypothetical protein
VDDPLVTVCSLNPFWRLGRSLRFGIETKRVHYRQASAAISKFGVSARFDHTFHPALPAGSALASKLAVECGLVNPTFVPMVRVRTAATWRMARGGTLQASAGATFSDGPVPRFDRFRIGGIPTLRGVRDGDLYPRSEHGPLGSDHYVTAGINQRIQWSDGQIGFHAFVNGGFAKLANSDFAELGSQDWKGFIGCGAGLEIGLFGRVVEANISAPVWTPGGVPLESVQFGVNVLDL